ncbi:tetratricopeptide repeat protein [Candidatus Spongiihabitans sp.]|uniref:tetratricopeptide repeat protein n=1 Tax=Candidatus Spongiihabitans sp. TaxID=3101308 RepID=UPI003C7A70E4
MKDLNMRRILRVAALAVLIGAMPSYADQNNPELDVLFARLNETLDRVEAAAITRQIWKNWYQSDIPEVTALMNRGELSMRLARYDEAVKYFTEITEIAPQFAEGWNRRATAYYLIGEYRCSTDDVAKTLALEPRHFGALSGQGMIYLQLQERWLALQYMRRALAANPHLPGLKSNIKALQKRLDDEAV